MDKPAVNRAVDSSSSVILIPKTTFNYVVIAISFLLLGMVMGAIGYERIAQNRQVEDQQLINQAVASALGAGGGSNIQAMINESVASALGAQGGNQPRLDPNQRYDIAIVDANPRQGPEDAPVTIVEFGDFRCGFCGRFARETMKPLLAQYEGRVRFVYRNFIIFGQLSYEAALAAECAEDQEKYWEYHDLLFENQQALTTEMFSTLASDLALDMDAFTTCFESQAHRQAITDDVVYSESLGLTGTPTFFINGRLVSGAQPIDVFQRIIDEELAAATGTGTTLQSGA